MGMSNPGAQGEEEQPWLRLKLAPVGPSRWNNSLGTPRWGCKLPDTLGRLIMNEFIAYEEPVREPGPR